MTISKRSLAIAAVAIVLAFVAGRATSPERGITYRQAETLVCTPLELHHAPVAEFAL